MWQFGRWLALKAMAMDILSSEGGFGTFREVVVQGSYVNGSKPLSRDVLLVVCVISHKFLT